MSTNVSGELTLSQGGHSNSTQKDNHTHLQPNTAFSKRIMLLFRPLQVRVISLVLDQIKSQRRKEHVFCYNNRRLEFFCLKNTEQTYLKSLCGHLIIFRGQRRSFMSSPCFHILPEDCTWATCEFTPLVTQSAISRE